MKSTAFITAFTLSFLTTHALTNQENKPDILFIAVDDLNDWINTMETRKGVHTPNLDKLAARGALFTNAHCAAPACNPSRTAVMTGISPATSGVYTNNQDWRQAPAFQNIPTLSQHFSAHGYETIGTGKIYHALSWTIQDDGKRDGHTHPDSWDDYYPSLTRSMPDELQPDNWSIELSRQGGRPVPWFHWAETEPEEKMADYQIVDWAIEQLQKPSEKPRFLAVGIYRPHIPWWAPQKYFDLYPLDDVFLPPHKENEFENVPQVGINMARRAWHRWIVENNEWEKAIQGYLASISFADAMIGRLINGLDESGRANNTIIVLWSDHGMHLGEKENWEKFTLWERSTRVPMIIVAPGVTTPGSRIPAPANLIDIYPTLIELANLNPLDHLEGDSLVPWLENPKTPRERPSLTTWNFNNHALRDERYRYIRYHDGSQELYDHSNDPNEFNNLAANPQFQPIIERLSQFLPKHNARPFNQPIDNNANSKKAQWDLPKTKTTLHHNQSPQIKQSGITIIASINPGDGVIVAQGGNIRGYSLYIKDGKIHFAIREDNKTFLLSSEISFDKPFTVKAQLTLSGKTSLTINDEVVSEGTATLLNLQPNIGISIAHDTTSQVGTYNDTFDFTGTIKSLKINLDQ